MEYRSPLARARGLGSAHHGSRHWWHQRVTALALLPLGLWFLVCLAKLPDLEFETVHDWFQNPVNSALSISFALAAFYHAVLGLQVIVEDYVHTSWLKMFAVIVTELLLALAWLAGTLAMLYILFGD